ncbi:restriction endonuclease subunit S [Burkholderia pseudomallei]|uniref:restriction endonuclease subunit S n=1 Tax=Burkholderia pseudomallei TaxID=28450 RepID=UPI000717E319|nr:restriction endonuclease subunit S [Burkholderia pseudomallei]MBF3380593.1 restriction endonuclease subunit S [Burkholderia pseudomallei]MBF3402809.1 restriction endonuclease subunit S [Burkholderia pseudomallei]ONA42529.1 restriction endonuclease [Burkholderia pseudomallei]CAJ9573395.1 type I restriction enzyme specificity protein [Burkholderia pseudomallei]VCQ90494.1 type I restriction enzyme specificity protein [Burkholderia pseudomallei]
MNSNAPEYSLESLCLLVVDCPHATPRWTDSGVIVLRNQNIKGGRLDLSSPSFTDEAHYVGRIRRAAPQAGDIVITREAPMGEVCQIPPGLKCCLGQRQVLLRPDPAKVDGRFLLYALQSSYLQHQIGWNEGTGSTVSNLRIPVLEALRVPTPALDVQREVAKILGAIDDRITLLRESNATLEAITQALFKSWFVDFDPVRAKQEGRAPECMDDATAALFPDAFEESELGLVPRGWRAQPVGDVVESVGGGTPDTKDPTFWEPAQYCWTTPKDLSGIQAPVLLSTERKLSAKGLAKVSSGLLPAGTLLMSSRAPIGYLAIAQTPMAINQGYIAMLPSSKLPPLYMLFWCRQNMELIKGRANGSTFMEISKKAFRPIPALVSPPSVIDAFVDLVSPLFDRLVENERQAQSLATLRDTLLPRLISGQLRLTEAEEALAA